MAHWEGILLLTAIAAYALASLCCLSALVFGRERLQRAGFWLVVTGFALQTVAMVARWQVTGHLPVMHTYENSLAGTWVMLLTYLAIQAWVPQARAMAVAVAPLALLVLGNGLLVGAELQPLEPAFKSRWLIVHVLFAWFAFGSYVTAAAAGLMYLLKERSGAGVLGKLPELKLLEELSMRLILFGFFAQAIMIGSGAIWAYGLWGRYWGWDPVETWSLVSWLVYGANLHLRITLGWTGRRAAWLAVVSFLGIVFLFFGFGHGSSVHTQMFAQ